MTQAPSALRETKKPTQDPEFGTANSEAKAVKGSSGSSLRGAKPDRTGFRGNPGLKLLAGLRAPMRRV